MKNWAYKYILLQLSRKLTYVVYKCTLGTQTRHQPNVLTLTVRVKWSLILICNVWLTLSRSALFYCYLFYNSMGLIRIHNRIKTFGVNLWLKRVETGNVQLLWDVWKTQNLSMLKKSQQSWFMKCVFCLLLDRLRVTQLPLLDVKHRQIRLPL